MFLGVVKTRWWFHKCVLCWSYLGKWFPCWLIFFNWVETTLKHTLLYSVRSQPALNATCMDKKIGLQKNWASYPTGYQSVFKTPTRKILQLPLIAFSRHRSSSCSFVSYPTSAAFWIDIEVRLCTRCVPLFLYLLVSTYFNVYPFSIFLQKSWFSGKLP